MFKHIAPTLKDARQTDQGVRSRFKRGNFVSATIAGACLNLIPVFGVGGAFLFLHERLTVAQWLGAGAILLAVYAIFFFSGKRLGVA